MDFPRQHARRVRPAGGGGHAAAGLVIGIDGGGSKTTALVAGPSGGVLGRGEAATSNHHVVGWRAAFAAVASAVSEARRAAGVPDGIADVLCLGLAGADTPEDQSKCLKWLRAQRLARQVRVVNDGALLLAATGTAPGVAVVSGTGSIAWGHDGAGKQARAGGWGHVIGDEGSGYHLAAEALRLTVKALDGRLPWGPLPRAVLRALGVKDAHGLLQFVYGPDTRKTDVARLAPVVFRLAARGEPQAKALLEAAAADLAEIVEAVTRGLNLQRPAIAFGGSLLARRRELRELVVGKLSFAPQRITIVREPARGALWLARQAA